MTPAYVGMATKTFKKEVFSHHKLTRYQQFLADYARGTPVVFFIQAPTHKGAPNVSAIKAVERFLVQVGVAANQELLNVRGTKAENWGIAGVIRGGSGKPSRAATAFRDMMMLRT